MDYLRLFGLMALALPVRLIILPVFLVRVVTAGLGTGAYIAEEWLRATLLKPLGKRAVAIMKRNGAW